jgi:hypothetical protein
MRNSGNRDDIVDGLTARSGVEAIRIDLSNHVIAAGDGIDLPIGRSAAQVCDRRRELHLPI